METPGDTPVIPTRPLLARHRCALDARDALLNACGSPGHGDRPRSAADERARADLRRATKAGEPVDEIFESFVGPLVEKTIPEWQITLNALLSLPEIGGPGRVLGMDRCRRSTGGGRATHHGRRFRRRGLVLRTQREEARQATIPLLFPL